jgi:hypothetical protein
MGASPEVLVTDNAPEETRGDWQKICRARGIKQEQVVPHSPWTNLAEAAIRELKTGTRRALRRCMAPKRTWCYAAQWVAAIRRLTAHDNPRLNGRVPEELVHGCTPDISAHTFFDFYAYCRYWTPMKEFPYEKITIGRWLGVAENCTDKMAYYILTKKGKVVVRNAEIGRASCRERVCSVV